MRNVKSKGMPCWLWRVACEGAEGSPLVGVHVGRVRERDWRRGLRTELQTAHEARTGVQAAQGICGMFTLVGLRR